MKTFDVLGEPLTNAIDNSRFQEQEEGSVFVLVRWVRRAEMFLRTQSQYFEQFLKIGNIIINNYRFYENFLIYNIGDV